MSKSLFIGVAVVFAFVINSAMGGDTPGKIDGPKIVAFATATSLVKPDSARLTFAVTATVEGEDRSAHAANELQIKAMKGALQAQAKVKFELETTPSAASIFVSAKANPGTAPAVVAKKSQMVFRVTVQEGDYEKLKDAVSRLSDVIVSHGGTARVTDDSSWGHQFARAGDEEPGQVHGPTIEWLASDINTAKREAIRRAMKEARADAEAAAGTDKLKIVETTVWSADHAPQQGIAYAYTHGNQSVAPAATGMVQVKVFVNITCTY